MIISFTGTPGSGKTYDAVRKIVDNLKAGGRVVYTNIRGIDDDICRQAIKDYCGLSDSQLQARLKIIPDDKVSTFFDFVERGSLIVLDEVQNHFGSRDWNSDKNKAFGKWASTHRHYGFDVVLITQHIDRLDVSVRALVEWLYVYRKINFFGSLVGNRYVCYSWLGSESHGKPLSKSIRSYDRSVFLCYQSYVAKDIKEVGVMRHANVLRHPVFIVIPVIVLVTGYMFLKRSSFKDGDLFGSKKAMQYAEQRKAEQRKVPPSFPSSPAPRSSDYPPLQRPVPGTDSSAPFAGTEHPFPSPEEKPEKAPAKVPVKKYPWLPFDDVVEVSGFSTVFYDDDDLCYPSFYVGNARFRYHDFYPDAVVTCGRNWFLTDSNVLFLSVVGKPDGIRHVASVAANTAFQPPSLVPEQR